MDSDEERYEGERRGLRNFLRDIRPAADRRLGSDSLLAHAISRALGSDSLEHYRHARDIFNRLTRSERRALSEAVLVAKPAQRVSECTIGRKTRSLCIESGEACNAAETWRVELRDDGVDTAVIQVRVRLGTLPSTAARALREIADLIEVNKSILSNRHRKLRDAHDVAGADVG